MNLFGLGQGKGCHQPRGMDLCMVDVMLYGCEPSHKNVCICHWLEM